MGYESRTVSVVVATRDRPTMLVDCVTSLLASSYPAFEVLVIDQSECPAVLPEDPRVIHVHSSSRGKSAALNEGLDLAKGPLVVFTDDDCTVGPDWIAGCERYMADHPDVGLLFGSLVAMEHDPSVWFVPDNHLPAARIIHGRRSARIGGGTGANMAARRSLFDVIGRYDEQIGPGSRFCSCEEYDIFYRALATGADVAYEPSIAVTHWGARPYADGAGTVLRRAYAYGEGAVLAKHIRLGDYRILPLAARNLTAGLGEILANLWHGRLTGMGILGSKWLGFVEGLCTSVDSEGRAFRERGHLVDHMGRGGART